MPPDPKCQCKPNFTVKVIYEPIDEKKKKKKIEISYFKNIFLQEDIIRGGPQKFPRKKMLKLKKKKKIDAGIYKTYMKFGGPPPSYDMTSLNQTKEYYQIMDNLLLSFFLHFFFFFIM